MSNQTVQYDSDVAAVETEGLVTFRFLDKDYIGQKTANADKLMLAEAGYEAAFDFRLAVRLSQFTGQTERPPAVTDVITIGDVAYHIAGSNPDQYGIVNTYDVKQET